MATTQRPRHLLAIDQGTTSSRAILFDSADGRAAGTGQKELRQHFPKDGWVEHDPEEIWASVVWSVKKALKEAGVTAADIAAIGITNQRETVVIWDRVTGKAIHNAIVWQDRRTAPLCERLRAQGCEAAVTAKTGLVLDPYFSASKIAWLLDTVEGARDAAEAGRLAFGTIDSFLLWRLTEGRVHATDATNAARTLLFDIGKPETKEPGGRVWRVTPLAATRSPRRGARASAHIVELQFECDALDFSQVPLGCDVYLAWPTARIAVMGAESAVGLTQRKILDATPDDQRAAVRQQMIDFYNATIATPWIAAERGYIDAVIEPSATRLEIRRALNLLKDKQVIRYPRKHHLLPL